MRLFHVSEEKDIKRFLPIKPYRKDLQDSAPIVWAVNEECLANFITPRDCPRVTYHVRDDSTDEDIKRYFSSSTTKHLLAIEAKWYEKMNETTLYIYEFNSEHFYLQDKTAGYYVSEVEQVPIEVIEVNDLFGELIRRNIEVRIVDNLFDLRDEVIKSTFNWSMCRMGNAKRRKDI